MRSRFIRSLLFSSAALVLSNPNAATATISSRLSLPLDYPIPPDTKDFFVADLNRDGRDDVVLVRWSNDPIADDGGALTKPHSLLTITVLLNQGSTTDPKGHVVPAFLRFDYPIVTEEVLTDYRIANGIQPSAICPIPPWELTLKPGDQPDPYQYICPWVNLTTMGGVVVADVDRDGWPDLVGWSTQLNEVFVLWNQKPATGSAAPYSWVPDGSAPAQSMTIDDHLRPLARTSVPIACNVADVDQDGFNDIACLNAQLLPAWTEQFFPNGTSKGEFSSLQNSQQESMSLIFGMKAIDPKVPMGFDTNRQPHSWPNHPLGFGTLGLAPDGSPNDGIPNNTRLLNHLDILVREADYVDAYPRHDYQGNQDITGPDGFPYERDYTYMGDLFYDTPSDVVANNGILRAPQFLNYLASQIPQTALQVDVLTGSAEGADSIWLAGSDGKIHKFGYGDPDSMRGLTLRTNVRTPSTRNQPRAYNTRQRP